MSKRKAILRPLALALVLATGFALVYGFFVAWLGSVWDQLHARSLVFEYTEVRDDGQPLIHRAVVDRGRQHDSYLTLDRAEVSTSADRATGAAILVPNERQFGEFPLDASNRVRMFFIGNSQTEFWYFVHDGRREGHGYFVGFDMQSKLRLGYIGRHGSCSERPAQEDCFAVSGLGLISPCAFFPAGTSYNGYGAPSYRDFTPEKIYLISANQLLQVDLRKRTVATVIDSAELVSLGAVEPIRTAKAPKEAASAEVRHALMVVRSADRVLLYDGGGTQKNSFIIPADLRAKGFNFYELDNGTALLCVGGDEFFWIDTAGSVLTRKKVTLEKGSANDLPPQAVLVAPAPIIVGFLIAIRAAERVFQGESPSYAAALSRDFSQVWRALLAVSILGAVLAWLCHRRQRRFAQPWTAAWVAFVFVCGLPGLVGYLFHRRWPVREACPVCGRLVPRDRDACAACGKEFPPPPPKGIEVFA